MAFTKVVGPGIHTQSNINSHNINSTGIVTATRFDGPFTNLNITGVATFAGDVSIGGTLTYEDVKNIDSVGLVTARDGIFIPDNKKLELGNAAGSGDLQLYHDTSNSYIRDNGTGNLIIQASNITLENPTGSNFLHGDNGGATILYHNGNNKFYTTSTGAHVNGTLSGASEVGIQSGGVQIGAGITQLNFIGLGNTFAVNGTTVCLLYTSPSPRD